LGVKFDPNFHDALFEVEDASKEVGSVAVVMKDGYMYKDRVLRPARVGTVKKSSE
jgi:molecular chaperone GrpE